MSVVPRRSASKEILPSNASRSASKAADVPMSSIAGSAQRQMMQISAPIEQDGMDIFSSDALAFITELVGEFGQRIQSLLDQRAIRQRERDAGTPLNFIPETRSIRDSAWEVNSIPKQLQCRKVEITGPVERKMIINALNSGADMFMADFEDSCSPTWRNIVAGQVNLRDAVAGDIQYVTDTGKEYRLNAATATLMVRPRGLHLVEHHARIDGRPVPASLFDFGLYLFHNAATLIERGTGPYFYLPKLESHLEARLWNDVFIFAQDALGIDRGTIKATVLIETLPAAFEMDEILYELREHSAGLNCGRWDYIFSFIKTFRNDPQRCLPDRAAVTMTQPFMRAYTQLLVKTCHRRGAHAMGGMAAQIPIKGDPQANEAAMLRVHEDKLREVRDGHDGTWVAHPGLVPLARQIFDQHMDGPNQIHVTRDDVHVSADDLLKQPTGPRTEDGLQHNVRVGLQYLQAWLNGNGCVPLYNLMEDAATAEISRAQLWQWLHHQAALDDGRPVTHDLVVAAIETQLQHMDGERSQQAAELFTRLITAPQCADFLTTDAYALLDD